MGPVVEGRMKLSPGHRFDTIMRDPRIRIISGTRHLLPIKRFSMTAAAIAHVVDLCCRHAWKVLLLFVVIGGIAFSYASHHFAIDTDTVKLFPPNLPWRLDQKAFDEAFPQKADQIAIVDRKSVV